MARRSTAIVSKGIRAGITGKSSRIASTMAMTASIVTIGIDKPPRLATYEDEFAFTVPPGEGQDAGDRLPSSLMVAKRQDSSNPRLLAGVRHVSASREQAAQSFAYSLSIRRRRPSLPRYIACAVMYRDLPIRPLARHATLHHTRFLSAYFLLNNHFRIAWAGCGSREGSFAAAHD